jgi:TIR domain
VPVQIVAMRREIPVGKVRFMIPVQAGSGARPIELRGEEAKRFERAFVSYASEDRTAVLGYAQALSLSGIEVFQDVLSLEPGERWERRLYAEIDRSDLFVLFWSNAASRSKWVVAEAEYALRFADKSDSQSPVIRPFLLEGPPIPTIPDSLKAIHFNDKFRYMILGSQASADAQRNVPPVN